MAIIICEYCNKPFNNYGVTMCPECTRLIEDSYIKARRYIYHNPKTNFIGIVENTDVPEKALSYLINKGRIEIANASGGPRCRACGKQTTSGALCDQCKAKLISEKLTEKVEEAKREVTEAEKKKTKGSFGNDLRKSTKE